MLIAENLGSVEPLTKGHLAGLGFLVLLWGSLFSAYKWISDGTTLEDRLFFTVIVLAIIVSAFLVLYFQKDISFLDFVARLRTTIK